MCPTFLRSVRPGFGTSDDLLSVYDRSDARGGSRFGINERAGQYSVGRLIWLKTITGGGAANLYFLHSQMPVDGRLHLLTCQRDGSFEIR